MEKRAHYLRALAVALAAAFLAMSLADVGLVRNERCLGATSSVAGFQGGVATVPAVVASDKTPFATAVRVSGLLPMSSYSVKVRLSSASHAQFGGTWNAATRRWCSVSAAWSSQPTVSAGPDGTLSCWLVARAGSKSTDAEESTASASVLLRAEGSSSNIEAPDCGKLTVVEPRLDGGAGWLRGAAGSLGGTATVLPVLVSDAAGRLVGTALCEPNLVDDDDNGSVDDETGTVSGGSRWFRAAAPSGSLLLIRTSSSVVCRNQVVFGGEELGIPRPGIAPGLYLSTRAAIVDWSSQVELAARFEGASTETITIEQSPDNVVWRPMRAERVGTDGKVTLRTLARSFGRYRAVWLGTQTRPASVSRSISIGVMPVIRGWLSRFVVAAGGSATAAGTFRPATPNRFIYITVTRRSDRRVVGTAKVRVVRGRFSRRLLFRRPGVFAVCAAFKGDRQLQRRTVRLGSVTVRRAR